MTLFFFFYLQAETKAEEAENRASLAEKMVQLQKNIPKPVSVITCVVPENICIPPTEGFLGLPPPPPYNPPEIQV